MYIVYKYALLWCMCEQDLQILIAEITINEKRHFTTYGSIPPCSSDYSPRVKPSFHQQLTSCFD